MILAERFPRNGPLYFPANNIPEVRKFIIHRARRYNKLHKFPHVHYLRAKADGFEIK